MFETKGLDETVPKGQELLLRALASLPQFVVYVISGPRNDPRRIERVRPHGFDTVKPIDWDSLRVLAGRWFQWVEQRIGEPARRS